MVKVAIIGGSGHVEFLRDDPAHTVITLSRKAPENIELGTPVVQCNYDNIDSLQAVLEFYQIHTVISCVGIHDEKAAAAQTSLIKAAERSSTTKRFIPSNWSCPNEPSHATYMPWAKFQLRALQELRATRLEWTEILPGYFLDFWGLPKLKSHMLPTVPAIDIPSQCAGIPGTGDELVSFSYTFDVARIVGRMLELPRWDEKSYILSDKLSWNQFLELAETATNSKFSIQYDPLDKLQQYQITELPNHRAAYPFFPKESLQWLYSVLGQAMARGVFDLPIEESQSSRFPDIKMLTVKEMLWQVWRIDN